MNKKYLFHHGIKGQRWGVRRFQNENGTLTKEGLQRYKTIEALEDDYHTKDAGGAKAILDGTSKSANEAAKLIGNVGKNKSKIVNNKDYSNIDDNELKSRINRINMEKTYGELTGDTKRTRSGSDWTREVLQTVGAVVGVAGTVAATILTINQIRQKVPPIEGK